MKKIAIFVEGHTEVIFVVWLLRKSFDAYIIKEDVAFTLIEMEVYKEPDIYYHFQISLAGCDEAVLKTMISQAPRYFSSKYSYSRILGLRDLFSDKLKRKLDERIKITGKFDRSPKIIKELFKKIKEEDSQIIEDESDKKNFDKDNLIIIYSIMEIEAWFLAEFHFLEKINSKLIPEFIQNEIKNINLIEDDPQEYWHPARVLDKIYHLINENYKKKSEQTREIIRKIDYEFLRNRTERKIESFHYFLGNLDEIFNNS